MVAAAENRGPAFARGPLLLTFRDADTGPFISAGEEVQDIGVMAGARTSGRRAFLSATVGYAHASSYHHCDCSGRTPTGNGGVVAYEIMGHANYVYPGLSLSLSGATGPTNVSYHTVGLNLELGYFGQ